MKEKQKVITAIKDLLISKANIEENIALLTSPANKVELEKICEEIMMTIAWMKDYNSITDDEINLDV